MTAAELEALAANAAANADLGTPSARKSGRRTEWPYVPVVVIGGHDRQLLGLAYATRDEALDVATRHIAAERAALARKLAEPRFRALRDAHGLPRELELDDAPTATTQETNR